MKDIRRSVHEREAALASGQRQRRRPARHRAAGQAAGTAVSAVTDRDARRFRKLAYADGGAHVRADHRRRGRADQRLRASAAAPRAAAPRAGRCAAAGWCPPSTRNMIVEYTHRMLAGLVAILIAYLAWTAWRRRRSERLLVRVSIAAFALILFQAALGGLTVEKGLEEELVATHLGVAMLQIGLVLLMARLGGPRARAVAAARRHARAADPHARWRSVAVLGDDRGRRLHVGERAARHRQEHRSVDAHMACGDEFPSCGGEFLPFGRSRRSTSTSRTARSCTSPSTHPARALRDACCASAAGSTPPRRPRSRASAGAIVGVLLVARCCSARSTCGPASTRG